MLAIGQSYYPANLKKLYFINAPYGIETIFQSLVTAAGLGKEQLDCRGDDGRRVLEPAMGGKENFDAMIDSVPYMEQKSWSQWASEKAGGWNSYLTG